MQEELVAGDTLNYAATIPQYPTTDGWTTKLRLVPRVGGAAVTVTAVVDPDAGTYVFQVPASTTASWISGAYAWSVWVEKGGERYTVQSGQLTVQADPSALAAGTDTRSQAERSLEAINGMLEGRATDATQRYMINGRELWRYTMAEILRLKQHLEMAVAGERRAAGLDDSRGTVRRILVRMP